MMSDPALPIRAVLFDFGGVLAEEGFRAGLRVIARLNGLDPESVHREGVDAVYESGYVTGTAKEADFWKLMREALFLDDDPGNVKRARSRGLRVLCCDTATQCRAGLQNLLTLGR